MYTSTWERNYTLQRFSITWLKQLILIKITKPVTSHLSLLYIFWGAACNQQQLQISLRSSALCIAPIQSTIKPLLFFHLFIQITGFNFNTIGLNTFFQAAFSSHSFVLFLISEKRNYEFHLFSSALRNQKHLSQSCSHLVNVNNHFMKGLFKKKRRKRRTHLWLCPSQLPLNSDLKATTSYLTTDCSAGPPAKALTLFLGAQMKWKSDILRNSGRI